eukprot:UN06893
MKSKHMCVPTLDMDLIWHSHQLDAVKLLFPNINVINHDDNINEKKLNNFRNTTRQQWNILFSTVTDDYCTEQVFGFDLCVHKWPWNSKLSNNLLPAKQFNTKVIWKDISFKVFHQKIKLRGGMMEFS